MQYPEKPFEHRDAVLGISFPMDTIDNYPMVCGEPSAALKKTSSSAEKAPRYPAGR